MKQILVDANFTPFAGGHGGNRRSAQIAELVAQAKLEVNPLTQKILKTPLSRVVATAKSIVSLDTIRLMAHPQIQLGLEPREIAKFGYHQQTYRNAMMQHHREKLLLWETTKHFVAPYVAESLGFNVIAVPHELGAFSLKAKDFHRHFSVEVAALAKAQAVFCIDRSEQWLLKLKGINAHFLPYYPPQSILEKLLTLRKVREASCKPERFLILGSASNTPTRLGMIEQLKWLQNIRKTVEFQVDIAGYGTEQLAAHCHSPDFFVHGTVTDEQLNCLMIQSKAALIHQTTAVGALTRIPELLLAGIPVIANNIACRSAFHYSGTYCYDDEAELAELITKPLTVPEILARPRVAEQRFIQTLHQLS